MDENVEVQSLISLAGRFDWKYDFPTPIDAVSFESMSNLILKFHSKIIPKLFPHFFLFSFSANAAKKKTAKRKKFLWNKLCQISEKGMHKKWHKNKNSDYACGNWKKWPNFIDYI